MQRDQIITEELAVLLGVKRNAILQWRWRKTVPHKWRLPILVAARERKLKLSADVFDRFGQ